MQMKLLKSISESTYLQWFKVMFVTGQLLQPERNAFKCKKQT